MCIRDSYLTVALTKLSVMKKNRLLQTIAVFVVVLISSASLLQCKKDGTLVKDLDRSFTGQADSTVYASFYESNTVSTSNTTPDVNDVIQFRGVQTIPVSYTHLDVYKRQGITCPPCLCLCCSNCKCSSTLSPFSARVIARAMRLISFFSLRAKWPFFEN